MSRTNIIEHDERIDVPVTTFDIEETMCNTVYGRSAHNYNLRQFANARRRHPHVAHVFHDAGLVYVGAQLSTIEIGLIRDQGTAKRKMIAVVDMTQPRWRSIPMEKEILLILLDFSLCQTILPEQFKPIL